MKRVRLLFMLALVALVVAACGTVTEPFVLTAVINGQGTIEVGAPVNTILSTTKKKTSIDSGTKVTLTAKPAAGWMFSKWAGACSGTDPKCDVTMNAAKSVTATFTKIPPDTFTVTFSVSGNGNVNVMPGDVDKADGETLTDVPVGTTLTLTAQPSGANTSFTSWSGAACESETTDTCSVTVTADTTVGVTFTTLGNHNLNVSFVQGLGSGSVSDGATIACDYAAGATAGTGTCSASIVEGTNVTLTATPDGSSELLEWGGCTVGVDPSTCRVTMSADTDVTARFVSSTTTDATVTITSQDDIGEEFLDGAQSGPYQSAGAGGVVTGTSFIELTYSTRWGSDQAVGLRFPNVNIPVGAAIESATITFTGNAGTAQGTDDDQALTVNVYGESDVAAEAFLDSVADGASALNNVTDRLAGATPATVWSIPASTWAVGSTHTVDVKDIVGEVFSLDGWDPGSNAIAFVLQNSKVGTVDVQTGRRLVDNASGSAPVLTVTYR